MARKILLADDSVTAQNMGRRILSDAGYDVTTVNNGSAALKKIAESKPDLIILDVYMPGYGGLELCQRLREAPETARIPVLLTVGKLEPFKAEESRRVRADGFIVKPFEASELLTALAKLEDKIVPQGQTPKVSRFARAMAAADESAKEFGDSETGWKNRLSIPPPHSKPRDIEHEEPAAIAASSAGETQKRETSPSEMKSGLEEALLSSLPKDITAEEIAAIRAAAAAFSLPIDEASRPETPREKLESSAVERESKNQEMPPEAVASVRSEESTATFASAPEQSVEVTPENIATKAELEATEVSEKTTIGETAQPVAAFSDSTANTFSRSTETHDPGDEEVTAALASLAPSNGHGETTGANNDSVQEDPATRELVPVAMAAASSQEFNGPRWIAEPVALGEGESSLALEQEMERAFAAFAAADAARLSLASPPVEPSASYSLAAPSAVAETPASPSESFSNSGSSESTTPEAAPAPSPSFEEPAKQESNHQIEIASPTVDAVSESAAADIKPEAALAAAAAAGSGITESPAAPEASVQSVPQVQPSEVQASEAQPSEIQQSEVASHSPEPRGESDLAAAWANWKQIRETVLGSPLETQVAESSKVEVKGFGPAAPSEEPPQAAESSAGEDSEEISSIVDSVLAEMKPRLMKEIARKMSKESKKK